MKHIISYSLNCKMMVISLVCIWEVTHQISLLILFITTYQKTGEYCNSRSHSTFKNAFTHFSYFENSLCELRSIDSFCDSICVDAMDETSISFLKLLMSLTTMPVKLSNAFGVIFMFVYILNATLLLTCLVMFTFSFCTTSITLNNIRWIFIPWLIVMSAVIVFDISFLIAVIVLWKAAMYPSQISYYLGYTVKDIELIKEFDGRASKELLETLQYFPRRMFITGLRHFISTPLFVFFVIIIARESILLKRTFSNARKAEQEQRSLAAAAAAADAETDDRISV